MSIFDTWGIIGYLPLKLLAYRAKDEDSVAVGVIRELSISSSQI